ncbi:hypothetical protein [Oceanobacillus saliphilus]|nr:hypothetical protein [Oceanobacillus saliphilus]
MTVNNQVNYGRHDPLFKYGNSITIDIPSNILEAQMERTVV